MLGAAASPARAAHIQTDSAVTRALDAAATQAAAARARLAATRPSQSVTPVHLSAVPPALRRPVTAAWTGQADTLVHRIAAGIGYAYHQAGPHPAVPVIIVMRLHAVPAVRALQDIGARVAREATVRVDPNTRTITYQAAPGWPHGRTQ